jgi:POT family proton-dependent oligopeptide transporter
MGQYYSLRPQSIGLKAAKEIIIGIYYLAFFGANNLVGWMGGFLEKMPAIYFWLLHAALCGIAGIIFLVDGRLFGHLLAPGDNDIRAPSD